MADQSVLQSHLNAAGYNRDDYKGEASTLCRGCGHGVIANQITTACFELNLRPEDIVKFSGIGCSSKSANYFLKNSFGFITLHGRMAPFALGASFADITMRPIGVSGDGDTASIGLGQFKHMLRRNLPIVYIIENNGVYGMTKGQFSATADQGLALNKQGVNPYPPIDIATEAIVSGATFVARSFAGNAKQIRELFKAAYSHRGAAVIDIISPCMSFNNQAVHSYDWMKDHDAPLHELAYIPPGDFPVEEDRDGASRDIRLSDGAVLRLKNFGNDYDPTNRWDALKKAEALQEDNRMVTGLLYVKERSKSFYADYNLPETPLNRLDARRLRPPSGALELLNESMK